MDTGLDRHLGAVLERHGGRWQIGQDPGNGAWFAVERPTPTAVSVHVAHTLAELAAKLDEDIPAVGDGEAAQLARLRRQVEPRRIMRVPWGWDCYTDGQDDDVYAPTLAELEERLAELPAGP